MINTFIKTTLFMSIISALAACGGGGGSSSSDDVNVQNPVDEIVAFSGSASFNGVVTYTDYPVSVSTGIDYANETLAPVRGVVVQLQDSSGNVLDTSATDTNGAYALSGDINNGSARIVVRAEISDNNSVNTQVIDNTNDNALYALFSDVNVTSNIVVQNLNAPSGWDGTAYSEERASGPFSILDVVYQAQTLVKTADSDVTFPPLTINWSPNNTTAIGDLSDGDIGTSFYSNNQLFILGGENSDTDEYDKAVVAHEWGHYFEDNFSRSDSLGGPHTRFDILNPTVSWSEGFATALAGMILDDPLYIDTSGNGQASAFLIDAEADTDNDRLFSTLGTGPRIDGYYSEMSVTEIVYDMYDDGSLNFGNADDDNVALGFVPIYNVLTNDISETEAFTSLFAFLHYIRLESPNSVDDINAIGNNENIDMVNITEFDNPVDTALVPIYTNINVGETLTVDGNSFPLQTSNVYGGTTSLDAGNKLLNQRFFRATADVTGCYTTTVTPVSPTAIADVRLVFTNQRAANRSFTSAEAAALTREAGEIFTFNVDAFIDNAFFTVSVELTPNVCFFG